MLTQRMFTVVMRDGVEHHIVVEADESARLLQIAGRIADLCDYRVGPFTPGLYLDDRRLPADMTLAHSPLRDGCRVGLGGPVQGLRPRGASQSQYEILSQYEALQRHELVSSGAQGTVVFSRPPRMRAERLEVTTHQHEASRWWERRRPGAGRPARWVREEFTRLLRQEAQQRNRDFPTAARLLGDLRGEGTQLWSRRPEDDDYLELRLGVGEVPSQIEGIAELEYDHTLDEVPVTVNLRQVGVLGVAGRDDVPRRLAAWLVSQAALLHSPVDVAVRVMTGHVGRKTWEFARWLPAARQMGAGPQDPDPRVSCDPAGHARQMAELKLLLDARRGWSRPGRRAGDVVLVLDGAQGLRSLAGMTEVLREGPSLGVYVMCLDADEHLLPPECEALAVMRPDPQTTTMDLVAERAGPVQGWQPDLVAYTWLDEAARWVAPVRDVATAGGVGERAPKGLLDLLGLDEPDREAITARWAASPRSTSAVVGESEGAPVALDIRRDGPHALIAGTANSGKSEFLRTWITSLAVVNRPDEMSFVLIDYKGGSAFQECVGLPHTVGLLTDLDPRTADRALLSLAQELRRREQVLADSNTKDIEDYTDLRGQGAELDPLPRLVIVVDEFSALASEQPDLMGGLVNIAQRGRSLGIHLVLATQRPRGVLNPEILTNTNLRIALPLTGPAESMAVIQAPDAGLPGETRPGLAHVRTGSEILVALQTCLVSRSRSTETGAAEPAVRVRELDWFDAGPAVPEPIHAEPDRVGPTDLTVLAEAMQDAARTLRVPPIPAPWLPPLPVDIALPDVPDPERGRHLVPVVYGMEDVPADNVQRPAVLDLARNGHLVVAGAPRTGRSQLLRTVAASTARQYSASEVHVYGIDCGDGALQALTELPHCGAVVTLRQTNRMVRLLGRLTATVRRRQELLAEGGFAGLAEQRQAVSAPRRLPYVLLLVDQWERFVAHWEATDGGRLVDDVHSLLRDGPGVGVCAVIAGDDGVLHRRLVSRASNILLLNQSRRDTYLDTGLNERLVPDYLGPGRAVRADSGTELQVALLPGLPTRRGQTDALVEYAQAARERDADVPPALRPFRIDSTPLAADQFHVGPGKGRPIGREDVLAALRDCFATGGSAALLGPRRAGKTWVLEELSSRLRADEVRSVYQVVVPLPAGAVDTPDALAVLLDRGIRSADRPAEALLDKASERKGADRLVFLLDEVGRLADYHPAAVSWLRDLGQAGACLIYTGTEKDWNRVVSWALTAPGSSFGNDVNVRSLGPLDSRDALGFLTGTAANLGVDIAPERTGSQILELVGTWPFYLQVMGDAVVRAVQRDDLRPLTGPEALRDLADRVLLDGWTQNFEARWAEIGPAGRAALLASPGVVPGDPARAQRNDLREVGLLRQGETWLTDRPFFDWIARNEIKLRDGEQRT
ncbi:FtsK/SpoIIIE domain-containing protein [Streptomyces sp. NPDC001970]